MRILHVAAFAVSGYASTEGRQCKPFNPLLGETYEADYPDKGLRFFSEKVFTFSASGNIHYVRIATLERKERKRGRGEGKENEEKWKVKTFVCLGWKGRERKGIRVFSSNLSKVTKNIHLIPPDPSKSLPSNFIIQTRDPHPSKSLPFLSFHFFPSKYTLTVSLL